MQVQHEQTQVQSSKNYQVYFAQISLFGYDLCLGLPKTLVNALAFSHPSQPMRFHRPGRAQATQTISNLHPSSFSARMRCTSIFWPQVRKQKPSIESDKPSVLPSYAEVTRGTDVDDVIGKEVFSRSADLREVSVKMWDSPEVAWKEHKTHDLLVEFMGKQRGWKVTAHAYGVETAFNAIFEHRPEGYTGKSPVIGFQSEMDALPGIGHACGHNLIAVSGIAAALGLAKAAVERDFAVRIVLIGTPAEEASGGKRVLLKKGAYKGMDVCL